MKIGILGAGSVGATLGKAWVKWGHEVMFGVRDVNAPKIQTLLAEAGANARAGNVTEAVADADVIAIGTDVGGCETALQEGFRRQFPAEGDPPSGLAPP